MKIEQRCIYIGFMFSRTKDLLFIVIVLICSNKSKRKKAMLNFKQCAIL